ncbi:DNA/RNA non-specific endonuclease [Mesorhizobium muleiense]|uniref:DNA/RNA non-specific endonuclease n=1 Tax=Mesorhizobium muleiense TaxID=1004279 RepID=UPI001F343D23|nr:DNA/RNA non-specific endonuclease [Mesorhizobium muleiense]MCF6117129.1 DNA/RNA non-specific endonuclease [Mesorhizobium muleiense]
MIESAADQIESAREVVGGPEARQGPTIDYVGVEFLSRGRLAANAVGRVVFRGGKSQGTGFLVGAGLFITNNHVIETEFDAARMLAEFDYEAGEDGGERPVTVFAFDPNRCFVADPIKHLDFTVVAIGERISGTKPIEAFGFMPLSDAPDKHMLGEIANLIQHPLGQLKQIVVRENNLVSRDETVQVLHYLADTERGSSGSPVCNSEWEPIALHHWGGPGLEIADAQGRPLRKDINEGVRVSAIVRALRARIPQMPVAPAQAVGEVLAIWDAAPRRGPVSPKANAATAEGTPATGQPRLNPDGSLTWSFPVEISVRAPLLSPPVPPTVVVPIAPPLRDNGAERAPRERADFRDRGGYEPGFIPGFQVPLPSFEAVSYMRATNLHARAGEDPHELRYHHFSIILNADRRLAAVTACNIDGDRVVAVNREDKTTNPNPSLTDLGIEALGAERSDDFSPDPRVLPGEQMAVEFYENQEVPGFAKPVFPGTDATPEERRAYARAMNERTARMFQKGHIIMRGDPAWGLETEALVAEADTFYYTNAAPQLGFFNQGSPENRPGAKGKLRWRAVETYILRNAFTMRQRISVFAGPVFDDYYDVAYREGALIPMRFWKIAVWAEDAKLRAMALLADQKPVLEELTQGVPERFDDDEELARVSQFMTTVTEIERLTKLDFGGLRDVDVRAGEEGLTSVADANPEILKRTRSAVRRRGPAKAGTAEAKEARPIGSRRHTL